MLHAFQSRVPIVRSVLATGSHPLPDGESVRAGQEALALAREAREEDGELVVLLSGGASAMLAAPAEGVSLELKRDVTSRLLRAGAPIHDLNAVRKHLSAVKGGRLAMHTRCTTFAISDVSDDDVAAIGSGPGAGDPSTMADALLVLERTGLSRELPEAVAAITRAGETPKPGDPALAHARVVVIGSRRTAMDAVATEAIARGHATIVLDEPITGDAATAGADFARRAMAAAARIGGSAVVIASGETTVRVRGRGTGGRNQEFALGAAMEIGVAQPGVAQAFRPASLALAIAAVGTDGIDGNSPAAGAIVDETTMTRAREAGLDARAALAANDTNPFFERLGDAIVTGPTGTNVGDVFLARVG